MKKRLLLLSLLLSLNVHARDELMTLYPQTKIAIPEAKALNKNTVKSILLSASEKTNWTVLSDVDGLLTLSFNKGDKHQAKINIRYSDDAYKIDYLDSNNLNYEVSSDQQYIHPTYNKWVASLVSAINNIASNYPSGITASQTETTAKAGLAASAVDAKETAGTAKARVRFFGQAGIAFAYYPQAACVNKWDVLRSKKGVSIAGGQNSFRVLRAMNKLKTSEMGMPATATLESPPQLKIKGMVIEGRPPYYTEFNVPAGAPLPFRASVAFWAVSPEVGRLVQFTCKPVQLAFVPEKNKDYEVNTTLLDDSTCRIVLNEIVTGADGETTLTPVTPVAIPKCAGAESSES